MLAYVEEYRVVQEREDAIDYTRPGNENWNSN